MRILGGRVKQTRLIQTDELVVAVEVELVIPTDDTNAPCLESETVEPLREIREHAMLQDISWLKERGKVCLAMEAA